MKKFKMLLIILIFLSTLNTQGLEERKSLWYSYDFPLKAEELQRMSLPEWVIERAVKLDFDKKYDLSLHMNPFFLSVDFDMDGRLDIVVWIKARDTGKKGLAIFIRSQEGIHHIGAGKIFGMGDGNYSWVNLWKPVEKTDFKKSPWEKEDPKNIGQGIEIGQFESSSGAVYWDGKDLVWYQLSD